MAVPVAVPLIFIIALAASEPPPIIPCTFSAEIISTVEHSGGQIEYNRYDHFSVEDQMFSQRGLIPDSFPRNITTIFTKPDRFTFIQPFLDRLVCASIPFQSPVPCFEINPHAQKRGPFPCPSDPAKSCFLWTRGEVEEWYIRDAPGPTIPDEVIIKDDQIGIKSTGIFVRFDPTPPDPSMFVVPPSQPCADLTKSSAVAGVTKKNLIGMLLPERFSINGMLLPSRPRHGGTERTVSAPKRYKTSEPLPDSFNSIEAWPWCGIGPRDQGECDSSWAFATSAALSARWCIEHGGNTSVELSPQWMVSCHRDQFGCHFGFLDTAGADLIDHGIALESCLPYVGTEVACPSHCKDGSAPKLFHASSMYSIFKPFDVPGTESAIMEDIYKHGPLAVGFWAFSDLVADYKGGVYTHDPSSSVLGPGNALLIGWGIDRQTKQQYWLLSPSLGKKWGENGLLRILRGVDECGVTDQVLGLTPQQ